MSRKYNTYYAQVDRPKGGEYDVPDEKGNTSLMNSAREGDLDAVINFLFLNCDPTRVNNQGQSALDVAKNRTIYLILNRKALDVYLNRKDTDNIRKSIARGAPIDVTFGTYVRDTLLRKQQKDPKYNAMILLSRHGLHSVNTKSDKSPMSKWTHVMP